jgi:hypothetical protein
MLSLSKPDVITNAPVLLSGRYLYAWKRGIEWLYIGISRNTGRDLRRHHIIGKIEKFQDGDTIHFWYLDNMGYGDIGQIEQEEIKFRQPKHNTIGKKEPIYQQFRTGEATGLNHVYDMKQPVVKCVECGTFHFKGANYPLCDFC